MYGGMSRARSRKPRGGVRSGYQFGEAPGQLTAAEEYDLGVRIGRGDKEALHELVAAFLKLVANIASPYRGHGVSLEDLIGEGTLGLVRAAGDWRPSVGARFATYARYWISNSIRDALRRVPLIRLPQSTVQFLKHARATERRLRQELGRPPESDETAAAMGLSRRQTSILAAAKRSLQFGTLEESEESAEYPDSDEDDHTRPAEALLLDALEELDDRERWIVIQRFGLADGREKSAQEIAELLGCGYSTATMHQRNALAKLREMLAQPEDD